MAFRSRAFASGSPPPVRAATVSSLMNLVKSLPRLASSAPFLCLIECHFECPDIELNDPYFGLGLTAEYITRPVVFLPLPLGEGRGQFSYFLFPLPLGEGYGEGLRGLPLIEFAPGVATR